MFPANWLCRTVCAAVVCIAGLGASRAAVYHIDQFLQFNGSNAFEDSFSDADEPPAGPISSSDYIVFGSFRADREDGELLELNTSDGASQEGDIELVSAVRDSTFFFDHGSGGFVKGLFELNNGIFVDSAFWIGIDNYQTPRPPGPGVEDESVGLGMFVAPDGTICARWDAGERYDLENITAQFGGNTKISMELSVDASTDQVTATWDYGSDGAGDLVKEDIEVLEFIEGSTYTGTFELYLLRTSPGDADLDGDVSDNDLSLLLANWGNEGATWIQGEFTGTSPINDDDLSLLLANWTGSTAVPEPATLGLLAFGLVLLQRKRRL